MCHYFPTPFPNFPGFATGDESPFFTSEDEFKFLINKIVKDHLRLFVELA